MNCRHCDTSLSLCFLDLGEAPPSNAYVSVEDLNKPEKKYPLRVLACTRCWLVQTEDFVGVEELFRPDYAYFSSTSSSWLAHAKNYCEMIVPKLGLSKNSFVVEVACNDGYLLKNFVAKGIPCLGIEPTASTAAAAEKLGIPVHREFFGERLGRSLAAEGRAADLIIGNNVYAHVPDINDFTKGLAALLNPAGVVTLEFPHLLQLIENCQFDTIYHEHFSYLSLTAVQHVFEAAGLQVFDVQELATHGGSLRVFAQRADTGANSVTPAVGRMLRYEIDAGVQTAAYYQGLQPHAERIRDDLRRFLHDAKRQGHSVVAYGAAAKGNTLLNFAGVGNGLIRCVVDLNPAKQGRFMPGSRIPIVGPDELIQRRPDELLVLPWNLIGEIRAQYDRIARLGTRFVVAVPRLVTV